MTKRRTKHTVLRGRHMAIPHFVWDCSAMRYCDAASRVIFLEILRRFNGYNNGRISLSVREAAEKTRVSIATANKKIHNLVKLGFIIITKNSGFNMKGRTAREFEITFHPANNRPAKNTFKSYQKINSTPLSTISLVRDTVRQIG